MVRRASRPNEAYLRNTRRHPDKLALMLEAKDRAPRRPLLRRLLNALFKRPSAKPPAGSDRT